MTLNEGDPARRRMLILDFDGVIVDTERVHFASWNATFKETFGVVMEGDHRQIVGLSLEQLYALWLAQGLLSSAQLSDEMRALLLARKTAYFYEIGATALQPVPGIEELIEGARQREWYVAIASRSRRMRLLRTLLLVGLATPFDLILATEDVVNVATDRKEHDRAARLFGIDPAHCWVIEDSPSGIDDALVAGIGHVIGITTSFPQGALLEAGAHAVVDRLDQVTLP